VAIVGKDGKVTLGTGTVLGMGTWSIDGISTDEFDASAFGDTWKSFEYGMKDGGSVSFNGHYEPGDVTGQQALQQANLRNNAITNLRLYINNTSYFEPCQTAGYFSPTLTTGAPTRVSNVRITSFNVGMDKAGLGTTSFTAKVSGVMVLV
jgi:hypothetical protein